MNDSFPPPFVIGQEYLDRIGKYIVIALDGDQLTIERPDGRRAVQDASTKARIHQAIVTERNAVPATASGSRTRARDLPRGRRRALIDNILEIEADGTDHAGFEIDLHLANVAGELGYSTEDLSASNSPTGRSVFGNEGDWAKARMTEDKLHEVVGKVVHWEGGTRRECNVYRITPYGLEQLRRRN